MRSSRGRRGRTRYPRPAVFISLVALLFTGACAGDEAAETPTGPNLLLITLDTVRADHLGVYGYTGGATPAIDRLAREGVRFAHAITAAPTTLPSHASIMTGATPPRHGLRDNAAGVLAPEARTLAEAFRDRGYRTGAFVSAFVLDGRWGLAQGFDVYDGPPVPPGEAPSSPAQAERRGDRTLAAALQWLSAGGDQPWFLWLHLFDAHAPYLAPEPFGGRFAATPYDGEIAFADELVGRLRARLEERGMWDRTTVVLTSDHGEALGEHGEPAHGFFLYEPTLRVPLIVRVAGAGEGSRATTGGAGGAGPIGGSGGGAVVETPVALIDIFSTVAELWGLDAGGDAEGRSLVPALRGASLETVPIYSETLLPRLYFGWHDLRAITEGREKFIAAPREELYDLRGDPHEAVNLAAGRVDRADDLREALQGAVERAEAGAIGAEAAITDPDRAAGLRALGYLGVAGSAAGADLADPKDKIEVYAAMMAALGAWELGNTTHALSLIDEQIEADPEFAGAWHFRGLVLAGSGDFAGAAEAFERALEIDPEHALAGRELARAYRTTGDLRRSAEVLQGLLATQPGDVDLRWELADVLMRDNRWAEARVVLQDGLGASPDAPKLHFGAGVAALHDGAAQEALAAFDRAALQAPDMPNLQYQRGQALEALGRVDEALAAYGAEAARQPRPFFALFSGARLLAATGAPADDIIAALRAALAAAPGAPEAQLFLAQVLVDRGDRGDLPEAEQLASSGIFSVEAPQLRAMGHATLAQIYEAQGRSVEAAQQRAAAERLSGGR